MPEPEPATPADLVTHDTSIVRILATFIPKRPIEPMADETPQTEQDWADIGREAALEQLTSLRKTLASEAMQERIVNRVNDQVNIPVAPEALEETAFDTVYDLIQSVVVDAVDDLIAELKQ